MLLAVVAHAGVNDGCGRWLGEDFSIRGAQGFGEVAFAC